MSTSTSAESFAYQVDQRTGYVTYYGGFPSAETMEQVAATARQQRDVTFGDIQGIYARLDRVI